MVFDLTRTETVTLPQAIDEGLVNRAVKHLHNQYVKFMNYGT